MSPATSNLPSQSAIPRQTQLTTVQPVKPVTTMRSYLDRAIEVLKRFGLSAQGDASEKLIHLLEEVKHVDKAKTLMIANGTGPLSTFIRFVHVNMERIRHGEIPGRNPDKPVPTRLFWSAVAVCLIVQTALAVDCARRWAPTHDEYWHLPVGLRIWKTGRLDEDVINPPLVRLWAAIPLAIGGARTGDTSAGMDVGEIGDTFWLANEQSIRIWFLLGRLMIVPLMTVTGLSMVAWTRSWYGDRAALVSLLLWLCCPTMIANGAIVTHDLPLTAFWILTLWTLVRFAERPSWVRALGFGATLGVAQLTKLTALLLGPLSIAVWLILRARPHRREKPDSSAGDCPNAPAGRTQSAQTWRRSVMQWMAAFVITLGVINAGYLFRGTGTAFGSRTFSSDRFQSILRSMPALAHLPLPLPVDYVAAADRLTQDLERPHPSYLNGVWREQPFYQYYATALLYKLPLSTLVLSVMSIAAVVWPRAGSLDRRHTLALLVTALALPVLASGSANQIGIRYVLPTLPLLHIAASQSIRWAGNLQTGVLPLRLAGFLVVTAIAAVPLSLRFHPHHLAWCNALAGGPIGGRAYLADSNIDWGQDLYALKEFLDTRQLNDIGLAYFGTVIPARIGIQSHPPHVRFPRPGWYAVSVNYVLGRPHSLRDASGRRISVGNDDFGYLRFFQPVARIGYSIDIYHLTVNDIARFQFELMQSRSSLQ